MKTISIRDFRTRPAKVRSQISKDSEALLTANGRPFALVTSVTDEDYEEVVRAFRMARAQLALREIRRGAKESGVDRMRMEEINDIVATTRRRRGAKARETGR